MLLIQAINWRSTIDFTPYPISWAFTGMCADNVPNGFFVDQITNFLASCDPSCSTCLGTSFSACTSCQFPQFLWNSKCLNSCPNGLIANIATSTCDCDSTCKTCSAKGTEIYCTQCINSKLLSFGALCVNSCPNSNH